jgi:hypothetical protein
MSRNVQYWLER